MNTSLSYIEKAGPEPDTSNYADLHRWDKWIAWYKRFCRYYPGSNGVISADGKVSYDKLLKSQRTRLFRENMCNKKLFTTVSCHASRRGKQ